MPINLKLTVENTGQCYDVLKIHGVVNVETRCRPSGT